MTYPLHHSKVILVVSMFKLNITYSILFCNSYLHIWYPVWKYMEQPHRLFLYTGCMLEKKKHNARLVLRLTQHIAQSNLSNPCNMFVCPCSVWFFCDCSEVEDVSYQYGLIYVSGPLSYEPVLHDWCNKVCGMCYPVCGMCI